MVAGKMNLDEQLKQWIMSGKSPTGDKATAPLMKDMMRMLIGHQKKMEAIAESAARVQDNIRKRAELREKKGMYGVPNIAKLLSGGAGSPISHMGRLQTIAGRPFKAQTESYKYQQAHQAKMKGGQGGWLDT